MTINLENRRNMDFDMMLKALQKTPKTFTDLLSITRLPRKTLSLRLRDLMKRGAIVKNGGYSLNQSMARGAFDYEVPLQSNSKKTLLHLRKNVLLALLVICIGMPVAAHVYATYVAPSLGPDLEPPVASFVITPTPPYYEQWMQLDTLTLDATTSYSLNGTITDYRWSFGDGTDAAGRVVTHTFAAGTYTVKLTVVDNNTLSDTIKEQIRVLPTPCRKVYLDPADVQDIAVGEIFTVKILVADVTNLKAWQFGMTFNPDVLECIPVEVTKYNVDGDLVEPYQGISAFEEGPFLAQAGRTFFIAPESIYSDDGIIQYHGSCLVEDSTPVSGSGTLAYVTFKVIAPGASELSLTDVMLLNNNSQEIPILNMEFGHVQSP